MTAGPWKIPNGALTGILSAVYNVPADSFKVALLASSSNIGLSSTTFAGVTGELSTANGYTAGGAAVTLTVTGTSTAAVAFVTNPSWTATAPSITARWAVLYEVGGNVLAYCLLDATPADVVISPSGTPTLTVLGNGSPTPILTLTAA